VLKKSVERAEPGDFEKASPDPKISSESLELLFGVTTEDLSASGETKDPIGSVTGEGEVR
jgi:hypothetical protein